MKVVSRTCVFDGFVKVDSVDVGGKFPWLVVNTTDSVAFLVHNLDKDEVLLVSQDRASMIRDDNPEGTILEVAAGRFDEKIGVKGLIRKELKQELGVEATNDQIELLNDGEPLALSPGVLTERQHLAYVRVRESQINPEKRHYGEPEEGELIVRRFVPLTVLARMTFQDMKTWALVQWFLGSEYFVEAKPQNVIMIGDFGKDLDDENALILAASLHRAGLIRLLAVVANLKPATERARLAKGTLNMLGLPEIPVGIGKEVSISEKSYPYEMAVSYLADTTELFGDGQRLLCETLRFVGERGEKVTLILNSGMTDAAELLRTEPELFKSAVESVVIMGGVETEDAQMVKVDDNGLMLPNNANNNTFDWLSAVELYRVLQEQGIPMVVVTREVAYNAQIPFSVYDKMEVTGNPIGACLKGRQMPALQKIFEAACSAPGSEIRGTLPNDRDRLWFVNVFCGGVDPSIADGDDVWPFVDKFNLYDVMTVVAAVPSLQKRFFAPTQVDVHGTPHLVIGVSKEHHGIRDSEDLRQFLIKNEVAALKAGVTV